MPAKPNSATPVRRPGRGHGPSRLPLQAPGPIHDATPKGIRCKVKSVYWPNIANLPEYKDGEVMQWTSKLKILTIAWTEPDRRRHPRVRHGATDSTSVILRPEFDFQLTKGPCGEALHLRGQAARDYEAVQPKPTVSIKYVCLYVCITLENSAE
jgi:hypothetical protein